MRIFIKMQYKNRLPWDRHSFQTFNSKPVSMDNYMHLVLTILSLFFIACGDMRDKSVSPVRIPSGDYRRFQNTPAWELAKATEDGDTLCMRKLLQESPSLLNYQEPHGGMTLLMMTIKNQNEPTSFWGQHLFKMTSKDNSVQRKSFEFLLYHGADVNIASPVTGETALMIACSSEYSHMHYIADLVAYGANINYVQPRNGNLYKEDNKTALMCAIISRRIDVVEFLVKHGADINYVNSYLETPLSLAVCRGMYDFALYLLQKGANYRRPLCRKSDYVWDSKDTTFISLVECMRYDAMPYNESRFMQSYKDKMAVVKFLKKKGIPQIRNL